MRANIGRVALAIGVIGVGVILIVGVPHEEGQSGRSIDIPSGPQYGLPGWDGIPPVVADSEKERLIALVGEVGETPIPSAPAQEGLPGFDGLVCLWDWHCPTALRITHSENPRQDPTAISKTGDYGLFQINRQTWEWWLNARGFNWEAEWMIPERNIAMAYEIWLDGSNVAKRSWHHWTTY